MEPARLGLTLAEVERRHILDMLEFCRGNRTHAARLLDISVRGLRNKPVAYAQSGRDVFEAIAPIFGDIEVAAGNSVMKILTPVVL